MNVYLVLINIAGAVTLLLWATRMVRTGMERSQKAVLHRLLSQGKRGHIKSAALGGFVAILLQSSTAVALIAAGFAASGKLTLSAGLATMLGADLGSAVVVQLLSVNPAWLMPLLMIAGGLMFFRSQNRDIRQAGRIVIGIALILMSLRLIGEATAPLREAPLLPDVVAYLAGDPFTAFLLAAIFTWIIHSSVAFVLLVATFAMQGLVPFELGAALVLGANMGSSIIAFMLTRAGTAAARRITLGNFIFRASLAVVGLGLLWLSHLPGTWLGPDAARQIINFHLLFNVVLLLIALPLTTPMARLTLRLVRAGPEREQLLVPPSRLDDRLIEQPALALASAKRELLRMAEIVERMLQPVMELYESADPEKIREIKQLEHAVNAAQSDIKLYLSRIRYAHPNGPEALRGQELAQLAINLEYVGDAVVKTLVKLAETRAEQKVKFSPAGWRELNDLHYRVVENLHLALNVLMSDDRASAELLLEQKASLGHAGRASATEHLVRLREGAQRSIATSDLHLETVRALKNINSLLASVAYPVLQRTEDPQPQ
ncbi:Na/Pi cotransporter family protein [Devosia sp. YIM 151766]|uniref:Na/Pi cotransporter family protein n=1 Tax=Devosia sp. YIM 151766 TaxID=3017325 RepID=UPI00255C41FD|nr:Na/Pi cotransporter family protein [Devosia sp. YIM 151766]WIY52410.1 Na/Pi cotransporter family protein [Devosia sp. YIM 151766]